MKKVILALAIVSVSFAACNSGETSSEAPKADSPVVETPAPVVDTAVKAVIDTAAKMVVDSTKK